MRNHRGLARLFAALAVLLIFAAGALFVLPGFEKRTDVCLQDFFVSEDGSRMTVKTSLSGSMGYIRALEAERRGDGLHCSFYRAFGGLNSSIGARNCFEIELDDSVETIYFDRGNAPDAAVLRRAPAGGGWVRP